MRKARRFMVGRYPAGRLRQTDLIICWSFVYYSPSQRAISFRRGELAVAVQVTATAKSSSRPKRSASGSAFDGSTR